MTAEIGFILLLWGASLGLVLFGTYLTLKHLEKAPSKNPSALKPLPPVSILKPLKGVDAGLESNLESFFHLDYPCYELIFCIADKEDPACAIVKKLMRGYPDVNSKLIISHHDIGVNPKINNLIQGYDEALFDAILISDSNVRVKPHYLKHVVAHDGPKVGMITAIVIGQGAKSLGGSMESSYLNTFYARGMAMTASLGHTCVVGKSMFFRRSVARRFGGLRVLGCYLAEDYMGGEAMKRLGLDVILMQEPVTQYIGEYTVKDFWQRHVRWGRIRKAQSPLAFAAEPLLSSFVSGLLGSYAFYRLNSFPPILFLMLHMSLWWFCDQLIIRKLKALPSVNSFSGWLLRELSALPLWINIACGDTVLWRGKKLKILPGGSVTSGPSETLITEEPSHEAI